MFKNFLTTMEKLLFPGFLFFAEVVFLVLFGLLVEYDSTGGPNHALVQANMTANSDDPIRLIRELDSSLSTTKTYPFFQDVHVMIFIGFGFLMTFLRRYGYSSIAFNMLVASFAIQWSTITSGVFTFIGQQADECCKIMVNLETMVGADFAAATALITMGAVLGRASPFQLIVITFFELMLYSANEAINIHFYQAADIGGSMIIHTFGAYFGLGVSFILYRAAAKDHPRNSTVYHSDLFAMIGTIFLWLFWPSFNGALASGNGQYRAIINTYYSLTASVISSFIFSMLVEKERKISMTHIQNATLAGGVAVGSVANMVIHPWASILIGFLSGAISVLGYTYLSPFLEKKLRIQDTCGVHNLHGLPGVFSGLASALAAGVAETVSSSGKVTYGDSLYVVFAARAPNSSVLLTESERLLGVEEGLGRHAGTQAGYQLAFLATTLVVSILGGLLTGVIVNFLPAFDAIKKDSEFFDDKLYFELGDKADDYLPEDNPTEEMISETKEPHPSSSSGGSGIRLQSVTDPVSGGSGIRLRSVTAPAYTSQTSDDIKIKEEESHGPVRSVV